MAQLEFFAPLARSSDPQPSHDAAESVKPSNEKVIRAIREYVRLYGPCSRFDIADSLHRQLGVQHDTIRTAVSRAGLEAHTYRGVSPSGRLCTLYVLRVEETRPL